MTRPFHLVLVTQELTRPALLLRAAESLPEEARGRVRVSGFTTVTLRDRPGSVLAAAREADLLLLSHILMPEDADRVQVVSREVPASASILALSSQRDVLLATRLGGRSLPELLEVALAAADPTSPLRALMRLFSGEDLSSAFREIKEGLPGLLEALPLAARSLETYLRCALAFAEPSPDNARALLLLLAAREGGQVELESLVPETRLHPSRGLYHPSCGIVEDTAALPARRGARVALLLPRGGVVSGDTSAFDELIVLLEERGLAPVPVFSESFDHREAIEEYCDPLGIEAIVSVTGFPLLGGHNRCVPEEARSFLEKRGVPYLALPSLLVQDIPTWQRSGLGLSPMEVALEVSMHELEGGIEPLVVQGPGGAEEGRACRTLIRDRAERLAGRLLSWIELRRTPNARKRIALTIFCFPPSKGAVGTAAYLDVFRSAWAVLGRLRDEGYSVEVPPSPEELRELIVSGGDPLLPRDEALLSTGARLTVDEYRRIAPESFRVDRVWGEPPGNLDTDGEHLLVSGVRLGNVFVGVQPSFGYEGDPMRLLFEKGATPHHGFLAYYRWIDEVFRAHAVVHLGTHGALEFMPGKQAGLSSDCWPDLLMSRVPHLYIYAVNNPSEGTIAKRRGLAVTLSHLTPPVEAAGLYRELENLSVSIEEYRTSEDGTRRRRVAEALVEMCEKLHLTSDVPRPRVMEGAEMDRFVGRLHTHLMEIKTRRIPVGLHVLGMQPRKELETELLASIGEHARSEEGLASFLDLWLSPAGLDAETLDRRSREGDASSVDLLALARRELEATLEVLDACGVEGAVAETLARRPGMEGVALFALLEYLEGVGQKIRATDELGPLMSALLGRYVPPGPGGDPVRCPLVLPTGRNLHALDPAKVPSAGALERAEVVVKELLLRRTRELGHPPRSIGMVLWGLDNIKTHGEAIAQAFLLLGTRPVADSIGRLSRVEVIPLSELGRPRVDVVITASGIFRDIFGLQMVLLDEAVRKVAELDESPDENFVRARTVEMTRAGISRDRATRRVFSNLPGAYGANVDHMVGMSTWKERSDLASIFLRRKGFSFSRDGEGEDARDVLAALAPGIDTTFQNLDSSEVGLVDVDHYFEYLGGLTALVEWKSGKRPAAVVADATTARVRVRSLEETVRLEVRTKLLNPRWIEGMLAHGYQGVEEVRKRLDYTFGWSATAQAVESWVYSEVLDTLVKDASVRQRMRVANPHSYSSLLDRLAEAEARGFFTPTDEEKEVLDRERERSEDVIEGVTSSR